MRDIAIGEAFPRPENPSEYKMQVVVIFGRKPGEATFIRGDANADGKVDITDAVRILGFLFQGTAEPSCLDAADVNDDGKLDLSDPVFLLSFLFQGGKSIPPPYPAPGYDPTPDGMTCLKK